MILVQIRGYLPVFAVVTCMGKFLDDPIRYPKAAALAQRLAQGLGSKLAQRSTRSRTRAIILFGAGQRIAPGHRL